MLTALCLGSGKVEVRLESFENEKGQKKDGSCCDEDRWSIDDFWAWFDLGSEMEETQCGMCDHVFQICLNNIHPEAACKSIGPLSINYIFFPDIIGQEPNPMTFSFDSLAGSTMITIDVSDSDHGGHVMEAIDEVSYEFIPEKKILPKESEALFSFSDLSGKLIRMNIGVRVYCDDFYYGPDCAKYCEPRDDGQGHYKCDEGSGDKKCLDGIRWFI
ncbi:hypothetical protein Btru_074913 [Bulinus truncatus]|nr:hypothetical protein Btru_074913 [Bulinus truncatus]